MALRRDTILKGARDEIELQTGPPVEDVGRGLKQFGTSKRCFAVDNVAQLAKMTWKAFSGGVDGIEPEFRPIVHLSVPQKFRMRIKITEDLLAVMQSNNRTMGETFILDTQKKAMMALLALLTLSIHTSLKARNTPHLATVEVFARKSVRCFSIVESEVLSMTDVVLCGYLFENTKAVKLFQKDVISNFIITPTCFKQDTWFCERLPELFPMAVYEQCAASALPYLQCYTPRDQIYFINNKGVPFIGFMCDPEGRTDPKNYEKVLLESLWSMDMNTAKNATIVDMRALKNITIPQRVLTLDVDKQELERSLMREYAVTSVRNMPFTLERTHTREFWKLVTHNKSWHCHVCNKQHTNSTFLNIRKDGRLYIGCKSAPSGQKTKYIGLLDRGLNVTEKKIEMKIEHFMSELLGGKELPFDLMPSNGGRVFFVNLWKDMKCPLCKKTHTHRDTLFVTHAIDTGAFFLKCKNAQAMKKPFLHLGYLYTREETRLVALADEKFARQHVLSDTPFPDSMDKEKKRVFLAMYKGKGGCFSIKTYNSKYLKRLAPKDDGGPLKVDTLVVQSACGTGKTHNVVLLLLEARARDKRLYHEMSIGYVDTKPTRCSKRTRDLFGYTTKEAAFTKLDIIRFFADGEKAAPYATASLFSISGAPKKAVPLQVFAMSPKKADDEFLDFFDGRIDDLHEEDFECDVSGEDPLVAGGVEQEVSEDPFAANGSLLGLLQGDEYIGPKSLEKISKALDGTYTDIEPSVLWISTRRTYARGVHAQYKNILPNFTLYLDEEGCIDQERVIISVESLIKCIRDTAFEYIILDEITSVFEQFYSPHLRQSDLTRMKFDQLLASAKNVICMDANITSESLYRISRLRKGKGPMHFVDNTYKRKIGHTAIYYEKLIDLERELGKSLMRGERAHVVSASKKKAHVLAEMFKEHKPLLVTSETNTKETKDVMENINQSIHQYGMLIHTSSITVGLDISEKWAYACYVIADPRVVPSRICIQMLNRVREVEGMVLHWHVVKYRCDKPVEIPLIFASLRESFIASGEMRNLIIAEFGTRKTQVDDVFDLNDPWLVSYLYRVQTENLKLMCHREMLEWRLQEEGYTMVSFKGEGTEEETKDAKDRQKEAAVEVEEEVIRALAASDWINIDGVTDSELETDSSPKLELSDEWGDDENGAPLDKKSHYDLLVREYRSGVIGRSDRWLLRKTNIMKVIKPGRRKEIHRDGKLLYELEKAFKLTKQLKRILAGIDELIKKETERFAENPSVEMYLSDNNLKLAVIVYISQLLGLSDPTEEKEVARASRKLSEEEKKVKTPTEVRIAEGSLESCVDWITLHQPFISGLFGLNWRTSFDRLKANTRNRSLQSLFSFGVGNRLDFKSERTIKGVRVKIVKNKCKLNELKRYFA